MNQSHSPIHQPDTGGAAATLPPVALRNALVGSIKRRRSRIRFRASVVGAACIAVAVVLFGGGVFTSGPERVLAIDDSGGEWVRISILDGEAGAAQMTRELQAAGIDGEVQLVPSVPQFVGHWMGLSQVDPVQRPQTCDLYPVNETPRIVCANPPLLEGKDAGFEGDTFQIRRDVIGQLAETRTIFYVGREPEPGEKALEFPPDDYDVRVAPIEGEPSEGSGSWAQSLGPGRGPSH